MGLAGRTGMSETTCCRNEEDLPRVGVSHCEVNWETSLEVLKESSLRLIRSLL